MAKCEICERGPQFGHKISASKQQSKRQFKTNVQKTTIYEEGKPRQINVCTKCLRTLEKQMAKGALSF